MDLALKNGFCELSYDEMENVDGGKFSFTDICKMVITGACAAGGATSGAKGGAIGFCLGGPAGAIIGGAIGLIGGCIVCNLLIKD